MILGPHTVVVLRAPAVTDRYGNTTGERDWNAATETAVDGCSVQSQPSTEFTQDRAGVLIRKQLFAPVHTDLTAADRVRHEGQVFEVVGDPQRERHGSSVDHLFALLQRTEG